MTMHYVIPVYISNLEGSFLWLKHKTDYVQYEPTHSKQHNWSVLECTEDNVK